MEEIKYSWAYDDNQLLPLAWAEEQNILLRVGKLPRLDNKYIQLNQNWNESDWYACTIYACCLAISSIFNYSEENSKLLIRETIKEAINKWQFDPKYWAYTYNSAVTSYEVNNRLFPNTQVEFPRATTLGTSLMMTLLNRNYNIVATYITSSSYSNDKKDWVLDNTEFPWSRGGHCIRLANEEEMKTNSDKPEYITVLDNYLKNNVYERYLIPRSNTLEMTQSKGWPYYEKLYFFLKK